MSEVNLIPEKQMKQLKELVSDKFVSYYQRNYPTFGSIHPELYEIPIDMTKTVKKLTRKMEVADLFNKSTSSEQELLGIIFGLEKEIADLRVLKDSIGHIKNLIK